MRAPPPESFPSAIHPRTVFRILPGRAEMVAVTPPYHRDTFDGAAVHQFFHLEVQRVKSEVVRLHVGDARSC